MLLLDVEPYDHNFVRTMLCQHRCDVNITASLMHFKENLSISHQMKINLFKISNEMKNFFCGMTQIISQRDQEEPLVKEHVVLV